MTLNTASCSPSLMVVSAPLRNSSVTKGDVHWTRQTTSTSGRAERNSRTASTEGEEDWANSGERQNICRGVKKEITICNLENDEATTTS